MPRLIVEKGHEKGKSIPLLAKATMVFGRDTAANVQIKDTMASRQHFKIEPRADGLWIVELQSMNGTLLNGHPVKEAKLNPGDLIRVGETMYSFLADDAGTDPLIGQRLGGYKILERVGRGGMGTVYKAEQVDLQRIVALKIISEEHLKNQEFIELFVHEARAAAKLNHTNIVQVYDVKKANELYYFSMEFVPGGSVQDLLNNRRKLPISDTVRMILEAARGLEYAHRKEIIHRDVKPDNFMIGEGGAIKIGDLGLAQRLGEKLAADNDNTVIGTPHYIAPEQVLGRPADVRSDVYSLGSTMYRMIAGFTPFQAPSVRDLVNKKAREDAVPLHSALEGIPESLSKICAKMMERLPENRTQSMTEVIAELEGWTRADGRDEVRESHPLNRKLLLSAVGLLAVVVIGGVIAAGAMLKTPPPTTPGPETGTTTAVDDSASAELKFDRAALEESRLVDQKPDAFDDVIKQYDAIVARWPDSAWGKDAERRRAALKERRLGIMAARGLSQLEDLDREGWKNLVQGFQAGREDLSEAGRRVQEFRAFADDPSWKGTDAAITAGRRAEAITAWLAEAEKRRSAYEALKVKSDKLSSEQRFREAWEACNEFIAEIAAYAPQAKDRYTTLLFDLPARRLQQSIVEQGTKSLEEAAKTAAALEAKGEYANAVATLELHARNSIKEASDHARKLMEEIHQRWSAANKAAAEKATLEQKKLADLDRRDFDATALRWREFVLKLDPKSALSESQGLSRTTPDRFPRFPATEARIITRVAALRTLADFKNLFLKAVNEKSPSIPLKISIERQSGTLVKASETHLTVALSAGQIETSFADILDDGPGSASVAQFLDYLRSAGKNVDPKWGMGVVILCFELGLYERALEDIRPLEKSADETVRRFVAEFKPLAEELKYIDSDEIEAQKHFERLTLALKDPPAAPRFDIGRTLQLLRNRFGETDFVLAQKSKLDEIEKDRVDRDVRDKEKTIRAERYRKILAARARAQGNSKARENEITRALAGLKDPIEGLYNLGESKLGFGDAKEATRLHLSAYDQVMRKFPTPERRGPGEPMMLWAARLGGALMRDFHLQKQESRAADIRNKIDAKYDEGMEYEPWKWIKDAHDDWAAQATDKARKLAAAEKELQENPDAKSLYDLAEAHDVLRNALEARGLYSALREEFPDFDKVKNGDALLRLAEMTWQLRDVTTALDLYSKMKTDHATHPKVVQSGAWDSVDNRIKACTTLKNQMGPLK